MPNSYTFQDSKSDAILQVFSNTEEGAYQELNEIVKHPEDFELVQAP
jgi:hypothetical protein